MDGERQYGKKEYILAILLMFTTGLYCGYMMGQNDTEEQEQIVKPKKKGK